MCDFNLEQWNVAIHRIAGSYDEDATKIHNKTESKTQIQFHQFDCFKTITNFLKTTLL